MAIKRFVALNFFPLDNQEINFDINRRKSDQNRKIDYNTDITFRRLPEKENARENYIPYLVSFNSRDGYEKFNCSLYTNIYLTNDWLYTILLEKCNNKLGKGKLLPIRSNFRNKRLSIVLEEHKEGFETVWLEPYYLNNKINKANFGFLVDYRFHLKDGIPFSRKVQQLSLSLNMRGQINYNSYLDRYEKIQLFIKKYHSIIFPITIDKVRVSLTKEMVSIPVESLAVKKYEFPNKETANSQYNGISTYGPLSPIQNHPSLIFVYRPEDKSLAQGFYRVLTGQILGTFPGMEKLFKIPVNKTSVSGIAVDNFEKENVELVIRQVGQKNGSEIPILFVPWKKEDRDGDEYFQTKYLFIKENIPIQVVTLDLLKNQSLFKWSVSNIGLQIFAKLGGIPWKVKPRNKNCLIIGIGQAHQKHIVNEEVKIIKYFAYSVLTDSSGIYKELRILGDSDNEVEYLKYLRKNFISILNDYGNEYDKIVIHTTFKIRRTDLDLIKDTIKKVCNSYNTKKFVVLKMNEKSKFFGYAPGNNSLVPYESTILQLNPSEFVVWFEGLQYGKTRISQRIARPMHIEFNYESEELTMEEKSDYLQDAINLSGANWRGFNAKSMPISVYYAKIIAKFYSKFDELGFERVNLNNVKPWFL